MKPSPAKDNKQPTLNPITQAITRRQTVNIHIDRIRITAPCMHAPTGKVMYYEDEEFGQMPLGATANQKALKDGGEKAYIRSKQINAGTGMAYMIEIHCCPPKILQKHNLFGHAVLQDYVYEILDLATKRLRIVVDPEDRKEWRRGGVSITEIHLTANFACSASAVLPIIQAIDDNNTHGKQRKIPSCITLGYSNKRRSTYHALTIYDKALELKDHFKTPDYYHRKLIEEAAKGIRAEVKLYSQELKQLDLGYVMRWQDVDITELFFRFFNKYNVRYSIQRLLTDDELACLSKRERNVYTLWLNGVAVKDQLSRTAAWEYTKTILEKTGINIGDDKRPERLPAIDLRAIFAPENVLPVPEWAIGTEYYFAPVKRTRSISNVPVDPNQEDDDVECSPPSPKRTRSISNVPVYLDEDELAALSPLPRKSGRSISNVPVDPRAVD